MIQWRNFNIDPDWYLGKLNIADTPPAPTAPRPLLQSGVEMQYIEPKIRAGDDFYSHANGKWLATTTIPADKPSWNPGYAIHEEVQERLRKIIDAKIAGEDIVAPADEAPPKVVNLMEALRKSLDTVSAGKKKTAKAAKPAVTRRKRA